MEGPERLVSNWGANGYMVDISDMFDDTDKSEINAAALKACFAPDGAAYEYPLVMTAHCMAVNVNALEEAGVKDLVDLESHTWTVEQFKEVVKALNETYGLVGALYCSGQGGDQGTRALVMIVALAVPVTASAEPATEITLWTYPVGNYGSRYQRRRRNCQLLQRYLQDGLLLEHCAAAEPELRRNRRRQDPEWR